MYLVVVKQKTAYELRISDWSSDVCSSDLWRAHRADWRVRRFWGDHPDEAGELIHKRNGWAISYIPGEADDEAVFRLDTMSSGPEIGRASCRERVCQYV